MGGSGSTRRIEFEQDPNNQIMVCILIQFLTVSIWHLSMQTHLEFSQLIIEDELYINWFVIIKTTQNQFYYATMAKVKLEDFREIILEYRYVLIWQTKNGLRNISSRKQIEITHNIEKKMWTMTHYYIKSWSPTSSFGIMSNV